MRNRRNANKKGPWLDSTRFAYQTPPGQQCTYGSSDDQRRQALTVQRSDRRELPVDRSYYILRPHASSVAAIVKLRVLVSRFLLSVTRLMTCERLLGDACFP